MTKCVSDSSWSGPMIAVSGSKCSVWKLSFKLLQLCFHICRLWVQIPGLCSSSLVGMLLCVCCYSEILSKVIVGNGFLLLYHITICLFFTFVMPVLIFFSDRLFNLSHYSAASEMQVIDKQILLIICMHAGTGLRHKILLLSDVPVLCGMHCTMSCHVFCTGNRESMWPNV